MCAFCRETGILLQFVRCILHLAMLQTPVTPQLQEVVSTAIKSYLQDTYFQATSKMNNVVS